MSDKLAESVEDDSSVTMLDVLQVESQLEEDAYAVLGASDDQNCTYSKVTSFSTLLSLSPFCSPSFQLTHLLLSDNCSQGYIRQALYACKTCCSNKVRAAVCLACSFHCHEGHELVELYTKRHFRCDCGNSKFDGKQCNLEKVTSLLRGAFCMFYIKLYSLDCLMLVVLFSLNLLPILRINIIRISMEFIVPVQDHILIRKVMRMICCSV